jgi:signal transduction histidine kinase
MKVARERVPRGSAEGVAAREDERRWLARELHDGPAQSLAAALFGVDLALTALQRAPAAAGEELRAARLLVRDALDDVRSLMVGLRPRLLEEHGLLSALQALIANLPLWGPEVTLETHGITSRTRLPAEIELALFRIAQEALSNARRHARATRVAITLDLNARSVSLVIADDGRGFTPDAPRPADGGEGLRGMRERAEQLGGVFVLESAPGEGTRITVAAPLSPRGAGAEVREGEA